MCANKLFRMMLLSLLACFWLAVPLSVAAETEGDYTYTVSSGNATITSYTGAATAIEIPAEIGGYPVTALGAESFYNLDTLTSVTMPEGLLTIGLDAFYGCDALVEVKRPSTLQYLGSGTFGNCKQGPGEHRAAGGPCFDGPECVCILREAQKYHPAFDVAECWDWCFSVLQQFDGDHAACWPDCHP